MPIVASATNPVRSKRAARQAQDVECVTSVRARLVSLDGGILLAACLLLTAFFAAALLANALELTQRLLLGVLTVAAWVYLFDSVSERIDLVGQVVVRSSFLQRHSEIAVSDMRQLILVHEGLNQAVGIASLVVRYQDGREERLALGPCWRQRELQAFIRSVERVMQSAA
jgi:hypothetical protein